MAAKRSAQMSVGSKSWIRDENVQVVQFCAQETEDFTFSARNEVEWLNEHMADIFSKSQVNFTEIFKTPGKLRGKTPRTAKKRNPLETREPLTDVFTANARPNNTPTHKVSPFKSSPTKTAAAFQVAEDPTGPAAAKKATKANADSGYHGLPEDDLEMEDMLNVPQPSAETNDTVEFFPKSPLRNQPAVADVSEGRDTTERSFHSAREEITEKIANGDTRNEVLPATHVEMEAEPGQKISTEQKITPQIEVPEDAMELDTMDKELDDDLAVDESRSPSQGSSPARPLVRKSSLTFAALPAREPLTTKKSIGPRVSRTSHLDQSKANLSRGSVLGRFTGGKSLGNSKQPEPALGKETNTVVDVDVGTEKPELVREESDADSKMAKLHNKSSTQRLHDRINMLGKSQPARPTKSIPVAATVANPSYPELPTQEPQQQHLQQIAGLASEAGALETANEDDDDWIQPPQPQQNSSRRPQLPKSISVDVMEDIRGKQTIGGNDFGRVHNDERTANHPSPSRQASTREPQIGESAVGRAASPSRSTSPAKDGIHTNGELANVPETSTTAIDSPSSKRYVDGPLSASKSKLQSIMKTARGLFSSSAGVSAQAKMETLSPPSVGTQRAIQGPSIEEALQSKTLRKERLPHSPVNNPVGRKTRSSTEKEGKRKESEAKEREQAEAETARLHDDQGRRLAAPQQVHAKNPVVEVVQQATKPLRQSPRKTQNQEASRAHTDTVEDDQPGQSMVPPSLPNQPQQCQTQKPKEVRRPIKPAKEAAPKPKPQPVAIRVGTLSQGIRMNNATLSSSLQESLPPPQPKQAAVVRKPSNATLHTAASNSSLKNSVSSATTKPKALIAAERKKEQDEKEAQRKIEQKREIERKRAAQQEEARKQEQLQRQEAERQRERERAITAEDPKILAKKQAIEKRRMEMKKDQQRVPQRPGADHAPNAPQAQAASTSRQELGGPRPPSRLHNVPDHNRLVNSQPVHNQAKPLNKRVFDPDADEEPFRHSRLQRGPAYQQNDGKRRKTDDEEAQEVRVRPTMAPPIRQSGIRQGGLKPSIFTSNYTAAPPPASQHHNGPSLLKSTTANQAYQQHAHQNQSSRPGHHPDIAKYQNGRIPFADNPNPPHPSQPHKTPQSRLAPQAAKSSPQYVNGENIHLDDIPTESEDQSESDSGSKPKPANLPDWAQSPNLRELLMMQDENMDADAVFGPVQSPHMEEMFRERHHRFRSRTSSANWAGADRLTDEEIRRDVEARQKLRREGGWTFGL